MGIIGGISEHMVVEIAILAGNRTLDRCAAFVVPQEMLFELGLDQSRQSRQGVSHMNLIRNPVSIKPFVSYRLDSRVKRAGARPVGHNN